jgi:hypothetical protein
MTSSNLGGWATGKSAWLYLNFKNPDTQYRSGA